MANINKIKLSGTSYDIQDSNAARSVTLTQAQYDALQTKDPNVFYIISDSSISYMTSADTESAITQAVSGKQDTLVSGTNIKTINNESILGSGNIEIQGGSDINIVQTTGTSTADVMSQDAVTTQLSGYVTTDTEQIISGRKIFRYSSNTNKAIEFKQTDDSSKVGFMIKNSASTNNEVASFEFRPNTFTIDGVQHPLMYFGHYRHKNTANAGVPQTVIGFRQYDQLNAAAYHYLLPLPEKAKTPFSLTTSFKDYYAPMGFKVDSGGTMVTTDNTGVVDLSSYLGGGGSTYTAGDGIDITNDVISVTGKVDTTAFTAHTADTVIHVTSTEKAAWNAKSDFSGDYNDLTNKPTIPTVPTSNTAFTNDAGYITSSALNGYATTGDVQTATNDMATKTWVGQQGYLTEHQSLSNYYTKSETSGATEISTALASKQDTLVSGTNIKTINNESILGEGNITIEGGGNSVVELTQAEYDALVSSGTVDPDTFYVITDAQEIDTSNYYTSAQTQSAITQAVSGKQDTLISGTNIKTINNQSLLGSGNITIQGGGGSVNVVQTTGTSTTDVMSQDAVTTQLNNKANKTAAVGGYKFGSSSGNEYLQYTNVSNGNIGNSIYYPNINGKSIFTTNSIYAQNNYNFQLVETSAITTSVTSSSTDAQVPSAKAVYDQLGGLKLVKLSQSEYDSLATKDNSTLYVIVN